MADQRIQWNEKMAGSSHANPDTLNRLMLIEHDSSGMHTTAFRPSFHVTSTHGSTSLGASGLMNIPFTNIVYDEGSNWTTGATCFWVPARSGKWIISAQVYMLDIASSHYLSLVEGNSTEIIRGPIDALGGVSRALTLNSLVNVSSANTYRLCFYEPRNGATPDFQGFSSCSFFQGHFIGI